MAFVPFVKFCMDQCSSNTEICDIYRTLNFILSYNGKSYFQSLRAYGLTVVSSLGYV